MRSVDRAGLFFQGIARGMALSRLHRTRQPVGRNNFTSYRSLLVLQLLNGNDNIVIN
jgi:hypothetical protein